MTAVEAWLRVVLYETRGVDHQESLDYLKSGIAGFREVFAKQPGFQVVYWGHDLDDGTIAAVSHWSSRHAIQDASRELQKLQADAEAHGIHVVRGQNLRIFPLVPGRSRWTNDDPAGRDEAAHARHRFRLHRGTGPDAEAGEVMTREHDVRAWVQQVRTLDAIGRSGLSEESPTPEAATWLRVVTYRLDAADQRAQNYMKHTIQRCLHVLEKQPGFQLGYWGRDEAEGTMAAVTYWNSKQAIEDAEPTLKKLQAEAASHGVIPVDVRNVRLFAVPTI